MPDTNPYGPQKFTGPFAEQIDANAPMQYPEQGKFSGFAGKGGQAIGLLSHFLEGLNKGKIQRYQQQVAKDHGALTAVGTLLENQAKAIDARTDLTPEQKEQAKLPLAQKFATIQLHYTSGQLTEAQKAAKQNEKETGKEQGMGGHILGFLKQTVDSFSGGKAKKTPLDDAGLREVIEMANQDPAAQFKGQTIPEQVERANAQIQEGMQEAFSGVAPQDRHPDLLAQNPKYQQGVTALRKVLPRADADARVRDFTESTVKRPVETDYDRYRRQSGMTPAPPPSGDSVGTGLRKQYGVQDTPAPPQATGSTSAAQGSTPAPPAGVSGPGQPTLSAATGGPLPRGAPRPHIKVEEKTVNGKTEQVATVTSSPLPNGDGMYLAKTGVKLTEKDEVGHATATPHYELKTGFLVNGKPGSVTYDTRTGQAKEATITDSSGKSVTLKPVPKKGKSGSGSGAAIPMTLDGIKKMLPEVGNASYHSRSPAVRVTLASGNPETGEFPFETAAWERLMTGKVTNFGQGKDAAKIKVMIELRAEQIRKQMGITPGDALAARGVWKADMGSLAKITWTETQVGQFEGTVRSNMEIARKLSKEYASRSGSPFVARVQNFIKTGEGDADVNNFVAQMSTLASEYAKIMQGSTSASGATVRSTEDAKQFINARLSEGQLDGLFDVMNKDMNNRSAAIAGEKKKLVDQIRGLGTKRSGDAVTAPPPGGAVDPDEDAILKKFPKAK